MPEYAEIRSQVEATAGRINGRFGEFDWMPLRYINRGFTHGEPLPASSVCQGSASLRRCATANLVAKEYVAAQSEEDPGVLVLSRFAGAADELDGAIIVNPYDLEAVAEAMHLGLTMPLDERQARWRRLLAEVKKGDIVRWRQRYVDALWSGYRHQRSKKSISSRLVGAETPGQGLSHTPPR